mgnify:CR=1 FL=1
MIFLADDVGSFVTVDATIGMTVDVGGMCVSEGVITIGVVTGKLHPTTNDRMHIAPIINSNIFLRFILFSFFIRPNPAAVALERAVARPLPAQIPACEIIAQGSSEILASA